MDALDQRIRLLWKLRPDERIAAAAAALPLAPSEEVDGLALLLVESAEHEWNAAGVNTVSGAALACHWAALALETRRVVLAGWRGRWSRVLEEIEPEALIGTGESIAALATDSGDPACNAALAEIVLHGDPRAAAAGARALLAAAIRITGVDDAHLLGLDDASPVLRPVLDPQPPAWDNGDIEQLLAAVAVAVAGFEQHRRKEVLLAALVLLESPRQGVGGRDALVSAMTDGESEASRTLRSAFRRARAPIARQRAWQWLREPAVALACTERIARAPTPDDHAVVLALGHLALAPARAKHLAMVPIATVPTPGGTSGRPNVVVAARLHPSGPIPNPETLAVLPPSCRRGVARLVGGLGGSRSARAIALDPLLVDPDPITRLGASLAAEGEGVRDFCFDPEPTIARGAAWRVCSAGVAESDRVRAGDAARLSAAGALRRSPHGVVRRVGADESDRLIPGASAPSRLLAAKRLHADDPDAFADWVRDALRADQGEGVGALMVARRIGAVRAIEPILLGLVSASFDVVDNPRIVASAVAALGDLRAIRSVGVLRECLKRHPDARVRANAAEALGRVADPNALPGADSDEEPHHRVRASVLRARLQPWPEAKPESTRRHAAESLSAMLVDRRAEQRHAGVWVVQRSLRAGFQGQLGTVWDRLAGRVRWMADEDVDAGVRTRATVVRGRLDAVIAGLGPQAEEGAA